jgi:hypothetical protein
LNYSILFVTLNNPFVWSPCYIPFVHVHTVSDLGIRRSRSPSESDMFPVKIKSVFMQNLALCNLNVVSLISELIFILFWCRTPYLHSSQWSIPRYQLLRRTNKCNPETEHIPYSRQILSCIWTSSEWKNNSHLCYSTMARTSLDSDRSWGLWSWSTDLCDIL